MRCLVLVTALLMPFTTQAERDYTYCEITGLAFGAQKEFTAAVSARIVDRQGLTGEPGCQAVWQDAYATGKRLSTGGAWSALDSVKWRKLQAFETKLLDSVVSALDLGL